MVNGDVRAKGDGDSRAQTNSEMWYILWNVPLPPKISPCSNFETCQAGTPALLVLILSLCLILQIPFLMIYQVLNITFKVPITLMFNITL